MTSSRRPLVIVPALNEQATIEAVVEQIRAEQFDVLVVDDGSNDETALRARSAGATVLRLPLNLGVGGALRAGFRFAVDNNYVAVVQVDADGQHPIHQIHDLVEVAERDNAHLVIGSRFLSVDTTLIPTATRRFAMWILGCALSRAAGHKITDSTSGFRIICEPLLSEFAREFPDYYLGDTFEAAIGAARAGYTIREVPASLSPRLFGDSSSGNWKSMLLVAKAIVLTSFKLNPRLAQPDVN